MNCVRAAPAATGGAVLLLRATARPYRDKLSRALLDRFDLVVAMPRSRGRSSPPRRSESSAAVAVRVRGSCGGSRPCRSRRIRRPTRCSRARSTGSAVGARPTRGSARVARTIAALAETDAVRASTLPRRSPTGRPRSWRMSELALAVFASETGPISSGRRAARVGERFDGASTRTRTGAARRARLPFLSRSSPDFPPLLRAIHDPPAGLFVRGVATAGAPRAACGRDRRRARMLRLRRVGRAQPRPGARRRRARRRQRPCSRHRRGGASRRARGGRARPSPCSAAASTATTRRTR